MEYGKLIERVMNAFYEQSKNPPNDMYLPILAYNKKGQEVDRFIVFSVVDKEKNLYRIETVFQITVNGEEYEFLSEEDFAEQESPIEESLPTLETQGIEFIKLYMKVREFAFQDELNEEQKKEIKKIVFIYDKVFEQMERTLYHKYGKDFFSWAYESIKS